MTFAARLAAFVLLCVCLHGCGPSTNPVVTPSPDAEPSGANAPAGTESEGSGTPGLAAPREPSKTMPAGELPLGEVSETDEKPNIKTLPESETPPAAAEPEPTVPEKSEPETTTPEKSEPEPQN
jgi:hypothetical protein